MKSYLKIFLLVLSALSITLTSCRPPELESAVMEFNKKRYEKAREKAFVATQKYPMNAEAWWFLGITAIETAKNIDDYKAGNEALLKAKELDATQFGKKVDDIRYSTYGINFNRSVKYFNQATKFTGDSLITTANKAIEKGEIAAIYNSKSYMIYNIIARSYELQKNIEKADESYKKEYEAAPDSIATQFDYGYFLFAQKKDFKAAIPYLEKIVENPRTDQDAIDYRKDTYLLLSQAYQLAGQTEKAEEKYIKAIEHNPANSALPYNLALIYYTAKNYEGSAKYFSLSAERGYENGDAYTFAGNSYNLLKKFEDAANILKKGLEVFPDSGQMWSEYAKALVHLNKKEEAEAAYEKAKKLGFN